MNPLRQAALFAEFNEQVLIKKQKDHWSLPCGEIQENTTAQAVAQQILKNLTGVNGRTELLSNDLSPSQATNLNPTVQLYSVKLTEKPQVSDPAYRWVSIYLLESRLNAQEQKEACGDTLKDRIWRKIPSNSDDQGTMVLGKGTQKLVFDLNRRFIVNLIGASGAGSKEQAQMLAQVFGNKRLSDYDQIVEEMDKETDLGKLLNTFFSTDNDPSATPPELAIGMITRLLAKLPSATLDDFPRSVAECRALIDTLLREQDLYVPIYLNVPKEISENRMTVDADYQARANKFGENIEGTLQHMSTRGEVCTLNLQEEPIDEVSHLVLTHIQKKLDAYSFNIEEGKKRTSLEVETLRAELDREKQENTANQEKASKNSKKEIDDLQAAIRESQGKLATAEEAAAAAKRKFDVVQEASSQEIDALKNAKEAAEKQANDIQGRSKKETDDLQAAIKENKGKLTAAEEAASAAKRKFDAAQEASTQEIEALRNAKEAAEKQAKDIQARSKKETDDLQAAIRESQDKLTATEEAASAAKRKFDAAQEASTQEIEGLRVQLNDETLENASNQTEVLSLEAKLEEAKKAKERAEAALAESKQNTESTKSDDIIVKEDAATPLKTEGSSIATMFNVALLLSIGAVSGAFFMKKHSSQ